MGTNYYAVKSVDKEKIKSKICSYIDDAESFLNISEEIGDIIANNIQIVHIGKSSYGWKFLFNHNNNKYYKRNKKSIDKFIRENELFDEYGKKIDPDEFWELVDSKKDGMDDFTYKEKANYLSKINDFYHDRLRFSEEIDFS